MSRGVIFLIVMVAVIGWVAAGNQEYAALVRSFLRNLFRQML
jgi:hypothetical protein